MKRISWLLRPLPDFERLIDHGPGASRGDDGLWQLGKSRSQPCALVLQWRGQVYGDGIQLAEAFLAKQEGREPVSFDEFVELWPTVEDFAQSCLRPRSGSQLIEPFCELVEVDSEGQEINDG